MTAPDPHLLSLLACPFTKGPLTYNKASGELISAKAGVAFPIKEGIPMLCADAARRLTAEEEDALDTSA